MAAQRYPVAYIRRSSADAGNTGDVSREAQESAVRALAHRDGHNGDLVILTDWSKSASESKSDRRAAYKKLVAAIEAGEVSDVYAYSLDRLNRSLTLSVRFAKACEKHDVRIVTEREGEVRQDSPGEWLRWTILATFGEYELRTITERNARAKGIREARGDHLGRVGYGFRFATGPDGRLARNEAGGVIVERDPAVSFQPMIDAVRQAGTILGGAKLLQAQGIPSPEGSAVWSSTTLRHLIEREAPELLPAKGPTGRREPSRSSLLAQLLVCHCGHVLTPEPGRKGYRCRMGLRLGTANHGLANCPERKVLPLVKAEAARLQLPGDQAQERIADAGTRNALAAQREKVLDMYTLPGVTREQVVTRLEAIDAQLAALDARSVTIDIPAIDWTQPPDVINTILRAMWSEIRLGPDMLPLPDGFVWRREEWRA